MDTEQKSGSAGLSGSLRALVLTVFVIISYTSFLHAQEVTGRILGTVIDSSGAAVPNAQITITNQGTAAVRNVVSSAEGLYNAPQLPAGTYTVEATAQGFGTVEVKDIVVTVGSDSRVDLKVQVGSVSQTVTVSEAAPLVNTTDSTLGNIVNDRQVADLPLNGRNWVDLAFMQPGVQEFPSGGRVNGAVGNSPGQTGRVFSTNGATIQSNYVSLDGANMMTFIGVNGSSGLGTTLGVDGIQEYKVVTSMFSAEYGTMMGSQTTIVTRGGTNNFHGDAFDYLRNNSLDARQYFDALDTANANGFGTDKSLTYPGKRLPPFRRNDFGGAFGGPIQKDKTFFWAVFEGTEEQLGNTITTRTLPQACFIDQNGVTQAKVPAKIQNANGACSGTVTNGPIVVNAAALPLAQEFPQPNVTGYTSFNYSFPFVGTSHEKYGQIRGDHTFSANDSMFIRYTHDDADQVAPTATAGSNGPGGSYAAYKGFTLLVHSGAQFATIGETHVFSPTLLNTFRFSYSRTVYQLGATQNQSLLAPDTSVLAGGAYVSDITPVSSVTPIGAFTFFPQGASQDAFTLSDGVFWTKNKHAFKFGTLIQHYLGYVNDCTSCVGSVTFNSLPNFFNGDYASVSSIIPNSNNFRQWVTSQYGWYAQDDYRLTSRLTLNLGFRYEFSTVPREKHLDLEYNLRNPLTDRTGTNGPIFKNPSLHNFSPRLGLAWDVTGKGTTAVKAGAGIYYDLNYGHILLSNAIASLPISSSTMLTNALATPVVPLQLPFPTISLGIPSPRAVDYNLKPATDYQYNLTIEHEFPWAMGLSIGYVGSRGLHLMQIREANPTTPVAFTTVNGISGMPVWGCWNTAQTAYQLPQANGACPTGFTNNGPRPNKALGEVFNLFGAGDASYNSLQTQVTKRVSSGLEFQFSYIYSKLLADGANTASIESLNANNNLPWGYNERFDRGPAGYDVTNSVRANFIYHAPNLKSNELASKFLNGWWFSSIISAQGGNPFTVVMAGDRNLQNDTSVYERPNIGPSFNKNTVITGNPNEWFNPTMFSVPAAGQLGDEPSGFLRGPGLFNMDFSIVKDTKVRFLGEAGSIEFRTEFFNLTNHVNFAIPTATAWSAGTPSTAVAGPIGTTADPAFSTAGQIGGVVNNSREIQLALKILF